MCIKNSFEILEADWRSVGESARCTPVCVCVCLSVCVCVCRVLGRGEHLETPALAWNRHGTVRLKVEMLLSTHFQTITSEEASSNEDEKSLGNDVDYIHRICSDSNTNS